MYFYRGFFPSPLFKAHQKLMTAKQKWKLLLIHFLLPLSLLLLKNIVLKNNFTLLFYIFFAKPTMDEISFPYFKVSQSLRPPFVCDIFFSSFEFFFFFIHRCIVDNHHFFWWWCFWKEGKGEHSWEIANERTTNDNSERGGEEKSARKYT